MKLFDLTKKLVSFNTVSPTASTRDIADFVSNYLERAGFTIEQYPYVTDGKEKVNVVARKGGSESFLALSGHMDTVPFNEHDWKLSRNPLELREVCGKAYGRGVTDMKSFLAIAMEAGTMVQTSELKKPFALCFTSDEEVGCVGARKLVREQKVRVAEHIVIGEPTEMIPVYLHKGYIYLAVELFGKKGHSSDPNKGKSVIDLALVPVLNRLFTFKRKLESTTDDRFDPPYPTMNIGAISTPGSSKNIVPSYCKIELDIRPVPGQDPEELFSVLRDYVQNGIEEMTGIKVKVWYARKHSPPMETPLDSPLVRAAVEASGREATTASYNTEGGIFNTGGTHCVIWGPGSIREAHKPDEFVEMKYLDERMVDIYAAFIRRMCT